MMIFAEIYCNGTTVALRDASQDMENHVPKIGKLRQIEVNLATKYCIYW